MAGERKEFHPQSKEESPEVNLWCMCSLLYESLIIVDHRLKLPPFFGIFEEDVCESFKYNSKNEI